MKLYEAITANSLTWVSDGFMGLNLRAVAMIMHTLHFYIYIYMCVYICIYIYIYTYIYIYVEYNAHNENGMVMEMQTI